MLAWAFGFHRAAVRHHLLFSADPPALYPAKRRRESTFRRACTPGRAGHYRVPPEARPPVPAPDRHSPAHPPAETERAEAHTQAARSLALALQWGVPWAAEGARGPNSSDHQGRRAIHESELMWSNRGARQCSTVTLAAPRSRRRRGSLRNSLTVRCKYCAHGSLASCTMLIRSSAV